MSRLSLRIDRMLALAVAAVRRWVDALEHLHVLPRGAVQVCEADVGELERALIGLPYERAALAAALADVDVAAYFGAVTRDEVLALVAP